MKSEKAWEKVLKEHRHKLLCEEKSEITAEKYCRDAKNFLHFLGDEEITKEKTLAYKQNLIEKGYAVRSVNSMIASLNSFLGFIGKEDCRVKSMKLQREIYCKEEKELSKAEYERLVSAAEKNSRLQLILKTICSTGIRVSELSYFTVESAEKGEITVRCKGKTRTILLPGKLRKQLLHYAKEKGISKGIIFRTKSGKPIDRSNIWSMMKRLCEKAKVSAEKVFPHNLRKLFAKTFYSMEKDIAKLADILGHSNINTTRIYIVSSGKDHRRLIEKLGLTG